jgi:hypothetical protein
MDEVNPSDLKDKAKSNAGDSWGWGGGTRSRNRRDRHRRRISYKLYSLSNEVDECLNERYF